jgi:hypothetical protein
MVASQVLEPEQRARRNLTPLPPSLGGKGVRVAEVMFGLPLVVIPEKQGDRAEPSGSPGTPSQ